MNTSDEEGLCGDHALGNPEGAVMTDGTKNTAPEEPCMAPLALCPRPSQASALTTAIGRRCCQHLPSVLWDPVSPHSSHGHPNPAGRHK